MAVFFFTLPPITTSFLLLIFREVVRILFGQDYLCDFIPGENLKVLFDSIILVRCILLRYPHVSSHFFVQHFFMHFIF